MLDRRTFVGMAALFATGGLAVMAAEEKKEEEVSPPEDLMREHGALNRILLIYDHVRGELASRKALPIDALHSAATTIQSFIENYHEKLEEDYLFPRYQKSGKLVALVHVLKSQHEAGRRLTTEILSLSGSKSVSGSGRQRLIDDLQAFVRMYRPHEAWEDTVLFPALRSIVSENEFDALGEEFEKKEHELFGKEGFEGVVAEIGEIEKKLGIYELAQFTPQWTSSR
jgi:hemerythrin-like domain-containing protein